MASTPPPYHSELIQYLATLPQPRRVPFHQRTLGLLIILVGVVVGVLGMIQSINGSIVPDMPPGMMTGVVNLVSIFCSAYGVKLACKTAEETLGSDPRLPILYLRAFKSDALTLNPRMGSGLTLEQEMILLLKGIGPVIAIGEPGAGLPRVGASRFYVSHDKWQEALLKISKYCQAVVATIGDGDGFEWEVGNILPLFEPSKILLYLPDKNRLKDRQTVYQKFCDRMRGHFRRELPELKDNEVFLTFDNDWSPHPLAGKVAKKVSLKEAIQPFHAIFESSSALS